MMRAVRLGPAQYPLVEQLLIRRSKIGKQTLTSDEVDRAIETLHSSMNNPRVVCHGAFEGEKLVSYLVQLFQKDWGTHWNMAFLCTDPDAGQWDYRTNGLDGLWRAAFVTGNLRKVPGVVWSLPKAWSRSYTKTQTNSSVWSLYHIETYREIPAGTMPESEADQWVFGTRPKPYDVVLRKAFPKKLLPKVPVET